MQYTPKHYAQVLLELTEGQPAIKHADIIQAFVATLGRHRAISQAPNILKYFSHLYNQVHGTSDISVASAVELSQTQRNNIGKSFPKGSSLTYAVDPTLIGGLRMIINNEQLIDDSLRNRIDQLFQP